MEGLSRTSANHVVCLRCGHCCRHLLLAATEADAEREPRIRERGRAFRDCEGYSLNDPSSNAAGKMRVACVFLDDATDLCTIYATRPEMCSGFPPGCENCKQWDGVPDDEKYEDDG